MLGALQGLRLGGGRLVALGALLEVGGVHRPPRGVDQPEDALPLELERLQRGEPAQAAGEERDALRMAARARLGEGRAALLPRDAIRDDGQQACDFRVQDGLPGRFSRSVEAAAALS